MKLHWLKKIGIAWLVAGRDLKLVIRYKGQIIGSVISVVVMLLIFFIMSPLYDVSVLQKMTGVNNYFTYVLPGLLVMMFMPAAFGPANGIQYDLENGTLEYVYFLPVPRLLYLLGSGLAFAVIGLAMAVIVAIVFALTLKQGFILHPDAWRLPVVLLLTSFNFAAVGILLAAFNLHFRGSEQISGLVMVIFQFFGGVFFPVQILPKPLMLFSYLLPVTWSQDLVRYYLLGGKAITAVPVEWCILIAYTAGYLLLGWFLLALSAHKVRENGVHTV